MISFIYYYTAIILFRYNVLEMWRLGARSITVIDAFDDPHGSYDVFLHTDNMCSLRVSTEAFQLSRSRISRDRVQRKS